MSHMRRREFITLLGGAAAVWPLAARAQPGQPMRRVGVLMNGNESDPIFRAYAAAFVQMLQRLGWREGQNLRIDLRWPGGDPERIGAHAAELVGLIPDVMLGSGSANLAALLRTTRSLKIVFVLISDPVAQGSFQTWRIRAATSQGFPRSSRLWPANGSISSSRHRPA